MNAPTINPKPKDKFQTESSWLKEHKKLLENPAFDTAIDFAMLEFCRELAEDKNAPQMAGAYMMQIAGAHRLVDILKNLSSMPAIKPQNADTINLNHRV